MTMRQRFIIAFAAFLSVFALAASPALAEFKCYCLFTEDTDDFCKAGEAQLSPAAPVPATESDCSRACGASVSVAITGSSDFFLLDQEPPNGYQNGGVQCYKNFVPPAGYAGSCKTVPSSLTCAATAPTDTPCGITIKTDATPTAEAFPDSFDRCRTSCQSGGNTVCSGPTFGGTTPSGTNPTATPGSTGTAPELHAGQGGTGNNQILSGSVLTLPLPLGNITLPELIARVIKQVLSIVGGLALVFFVWGGIRWMLARGASDEIAKAKKMIVAAVSGLIAIFASYAVLDLVIRSVSK